MATNTLFTQFLTGLQAEHIKKRGTGIYTMSAFTGILFPLIVFIHSLFKASQRAKPFDYSYYASFLIDTAPPLTNFFFPLLVIMVASRVTQLDHRNGGWQLMETQPVSKFAIYFSKFSIVLISMAIAILSFMASGLCFGWLISLVSTVPDTAQFHIPIKELAQLGSRLFLAALYIAALQYVVAVLMPSFVWSIIIGFAALMAGVIAKPLGYDFDWYPYHILPRITDYKTGSDLGHWFVYTELVSLFAAIALLYIGFQWYRYHTLKRAFLFKTSRLLSLIVVLATVGGIITYLMAPRMTKPYQATVLAGEIDTPFPLKTAYVVNHLLQDTLAVITVEDNAFHYTFTDEIVDDYYFIEFDKFFRTSVYLGTQDSLFIKAKANESATEFNITGTRLAENRAPQPGQSRSMVSYYLEQNLHLDNPPFFSNEVHKDWKKKMKERKVFKTIDGYVPRADFDERLEKMLAVRYLNYWNDYETKRKAAFPDEETVTTPEIQEIKEQVSLSDESLLGYEPYLEYVIYSLVASNQEDIAEDAKALLGISQIEEGTFKDKLLFWQINKSLNDASDSEERATIIEQFGDAFSDVRYINKAEAIYHLLQSLGKGEPAPAFDAVDIDGNVVSLADLQGRHVVIDVWATWCAPCKVQSPYFEKLAIKYKDQPISFLALSIDRDKSKWDIEARNKSRSVAQWYAQDMETFGRDFNMSAIPRFILLDPVGRFTHAQMPFPSESAFEVILRKELGLPD